MRGIPERAVQQNLNYKNKIKRKKNVFVNRSNALKNGVPSLFSFSPNLFWNFIHHYHHELFLISNTLF